MRGYNLVFDVQVRSDKVYNYFIKSHPEFCAKAEGLGVKFVSILHEEDHPTNNGRGWRSTFNAFTKEEAEERMKQLDIYFEWLPNNDVKTITPAVPAVEHNRESGRKSFSSSVVTAFSGWITSSEDPKKAVRLGDDTPVDQLALDDLVHFMRKVSPMLHVRLHPLYANSLWFLLPVLFRSV